MKLKFFSKLLHISGVSLIIVISSLSIILGFITRELNDFDPKKKYLEYISSFEDRFFDYRMRPHMENTKEDNEVVLIKVDDESLHKINSWPIPRENWATMLTNLKHFGAKVVAFDVIYPEPVKACGEESPDDLFASAIEDFQSVPGNRIVMAYTVQSIYSQKEFFEEMPADLYANITESRVANEERSFHKSVVEKQTWPIQTLLNPEPDLGYISMQEDGDGVFRHYKLVANVEGLFFPSMALRSYMSITGTNPTIEVDITSQGRVTINDKTLYLNSKGESKVRWIGGEEKFQDISLYDVISAPIDSEKMKLLFNNKVVYIGSTATGAHDLRNTPISSVMPGVYVHMNMHHILKNQFFFKPMEESIKYSFFLLVGSMIVLLVIMYFGRAILDIFSLIAICAGIYALDYFYFIPNGYEIRLFSNLFSLISSYSWITFLNFNQASAEKKQIKGAFSRYVAPSIVNDMLDNPDKLKVGGDKKDITCLFSDVRDFTSISEKLSATELSMALNRYMGEMTDIVFETEGTLDKYIGDAIVAFWGAPIDIGDHVNKACTAAVRMLEQLPAINEEFKEKGLPEFKIGLGLNSGECSVGNMGSDQIFAYTALGDNMNLGARLESLCKHYGAQILVSEYTYEKMDHNKFTCRLIDKVRVKGKTEPVGVYEVLYSYHPFMKDQDSLAAFKNAYQFFLDKEFDKAKQILEEILQLHEQDKSTIRMLEACNHWIENPPQEGEDHTITTMTSK